MDTFDDNIDATNWLSFLVHVLVASKFKLFSYFLDLTDLWLAQCLEQWILKYKGIEVYVFPFEVHMF